MAQRGGSVEGSVRIGKEVFSPIINKADFIIALEKLEGLRYLSRLDSKGFIIINDYEIYPATVFLKGNAYPRDIENKTSRATNNYIFIKAMEIAKKLNKIKTSNMVLLGALSNFIPFDYKIWVSAINVNVPREAVEVNIEAFNQGRKLI
jgi:indolepyruvate ferredoxin oxidoreductase beta subunit